MPQQTGGRGQSEKRALQPIPDQLRPQIFQETATKVVSMAETRLAGSTAPEASTPKEHKDAAPQHVQVRTSTVGSLPGNEQKEDLPMNIEPVIPTTGRSQANQASALQASSLETFKDGPATPAKVELSAEGGILNSAQGVHFAGSTTLNSTQIQVHNNVYNTTVQPDVSEKDAQLFEKIVGWLSDINYHAIQADNYGKRAQGTGEWAFDDPKIVDWLGGVLGILWGVGMPGAGKTVLASIIIDHLLQKAKANKRICVAFAFSRYTDRFTGDKVLAGLLRQVVQDHPSTLAFVKPMYDYHHQRKT
ncbi:hypothetical protein FA15DRAFT_711918 [Coprinopsis marcescibilis]|uniref:Nephrocystin 3-like N-terminal domain-containing protein n=1 Tax=Coprinopsis marcescibilis TaxID=230819 RepID=A0A5C3K940_COPMA|nr:hypothetical protein FA15DRAFT_711918 [Coprinopsis marcescibilis]